MNGKENPELPLQKSAVAPVPSTAIEDPSAPKKKCTKCCKSIKIICCILLVIIVVIIGVFLFFAFYILKKRAVQVAASSATLENLSFTIVPITLNLVMGVNIGVKNPNYAGYKYQDTNTTFFYHGLVSGISPMPAGVVKARSSKKIHSTVYMNATTMINTPYLLPELIAGKIPLSSRTYMAGKVTLFTYIKLCATVLTTCDITVNLQSSTTTAKCNGDVKIL